MKTALKLPLIIILFALGLFLTACTKSPAVDNEKSENKTLIAVSIVPQESFVKEVCGDLADTIVMIPPGFSPENYEPTPVEMMKFTDADIYFTVGVPAEDSNILPSVSSDTKVVSLADVVSSEYDDLTIGSGRDPHIWLSPKRAVAMVRSIADEVCAYDPENTETYRANAESYIKELESLDEEIKDILKDVKNRKFLVYHPAFGYFADEYGLSMFSLEEEGKEATAEHLAQMVDLAKSEGIKVLFYQAEIDSSQSRAFAEELGGVTVMLSPLSGDYENNLLNMARSIAEAMN